MKEPGTDDQDRVCASVYVLVCIRTVLHPHAYLLVDGTTAHNNYNQGQAHAISWKEKC